MKIFFGEPMIDIVFTASNTFVGRAIRWLTKGTVSHAALDYHNNMFGTSWTMEATGRGAWTIPTINAHNNVTRRFRCRFDTISALQQLTVVLSAPYDYEGVFFLGIIKLWWKLFRRKMKKFWHRTSTMFCSELVATFLQNAGFCGSWDVELVDPQMLLDFCITNPDLFDEIIV